MIDLIPKVPEVDDVENVSIPSLDLHWIGEESLPPFPHCDKLRVAKCDEQVWVSTLDLFRALKNNSSKAHLHTKIRKRLTTHLKCEYKRTKHTHEWNLELLVWEDRLDSCSDEALDMIPMKDIRTFGEWALKRARKNRDEKRRLWQRLNIELTEDEAGAIKVPIEEELVNALSMACDVPLERQYRLGKYRLDAYLPRYRIAVQIDENGHQGYDEEEEKELNQLIRDSNIVLIRFNPDEKRIGPPTYALIRAVWTRMLSPDYTSFAREHKL